MPVALTKGLDQKCHDCGIALHKHEIAYEIQGIFIDYIEHETGEIDITLCTGCRDRLVEYLKKDQGDAILKRKQIENDGTGPLKPLVFPEPEIDDFKAPDPTGMGM